ncbi:peptidoglycan-binding protein [Streptomyces sp. FIT100]|uniref:peptidoglycan-binding protein n=1 Tax=Streptomyces sp. FIT100 TaxID=2837956 RepID=UPI0021C7027F|nr:peptidoglycan-binding protein [Streptomyces sp. FIT100]UUN26635.1 peptidoglycan-binding protein [Streptomyces sp. FIT100]
MFLLARGYADHWSNSALSGGRRYRAERRRGDVTAYPGGRFFRAGARNAYAECLRAMLVARGAARYYDDAAPDGWSLHDLRACAAFQRAQGWHPSRCRGIPDRITWRLLVDGRGKDIVPCPSVSYVITDCPGPLRSRRFGPG